ncbi:MAG: M16 family metallopeptidase [Anaerolineales bacterium]
MAEAAKSLPSLDLSSLPGPDDILRQELDNGVVVMSRENFASPSIVISGFLPAGSIFDPSGKEGLASLTASALMRGTGQRSFNEIYQSIESIGANLSIGAGTHFASFRGKALAADLPLLLELLAEALQEPTFPEAAVEQLRAEKLTGLSIRDQNTRARANMAFDELAYPDHPYRRPSDGHRETVTNLNLTDLERFHTEHYGPAGLVISIVGAIKVEEAVEAVAGALGAWTARAEVSELHVPDVEAPEKLVRTHVPLADKSQSDFVLGAPGPRRSHPDYLAASLGNNVLGRFGLMGRLGDSIREQAGLAYYAYSSLGGGVGPSPWRVMAGVNPENVEKAIDLARKELGRFAQEEVTAEELFDVQSNYIGRLPLQLESNEGVAGSLIHIERHGLGLDYYRRYPGLIAEVTRSDIQRVAEEFLHPDRLALGIAGPS